MESVREKISFYLSAAVYVVFNVRLGSDIPTTIIETIKQILLTAPFVAGGTFFVVSFLHYASGGEKIPWDRILRVFFAIGILAGLVFGIYEYAGVDTVPGK